MCSQVHGARRRRRASEAVTSRRTDEGTTKPNTSFARHMEQKLHNCKGNLFCFLFFFPIEGLWTVELAVACSELEVTACIEAGLRNNQSTITAERRAVTNDAA